MCDKSDTNCIKNFSYCECSPIKDTERMMTTISITNISAKNNLTMVSKTQASMYLPYTCL